MRSMVEGPLGLKSPSTTLGVVPLPCKCMGGFRPAHLRVKIAVGKPRAARLSGAANRQGRTAPDVRSGVRPKQGAVAAYPVPTSVEGNYGNG